MIFQPSRHRIFTRKAFTLVELMVTVVIVGILGAIAVVGYQKYVLKTQMAEAYINIGAITKAQVAYFLEKKHFLFVGPKPRKIPTSKTPFGPEPSEINDFLIVNQWQRLGNPIPNGTKLLFSYGMGAGKTTAAGEPLFTGSAAPPEEYDVDGDTLSSGWTCTNGLQSGGSCTESDLAAQNYISDIGYGHTIGKPYYNWLFLVAVADLKKGPPTIGSPCTSLIKIIDTNETGAIVTSRPIQVKHLGE